MEGLRIHHVLRGLRNVKRSQNMKSYYPDIRRKTKYISHQILRRKINIITEFICKQVPLK